MKEIVKKNLGTFEYNPKDPDLKGKIKSLLAQLITDNKGHRLPLTKILNHR